MGGKMTKNANTDLKMTACGLIRQQMLEHPERIAIIDGETHLSYKSLMDRAGEVAGELEHRGIMPGSLVGVCMGRSGEMIATLVGIMQAGHAYVPLDPEYPQDRVGYMLKHSRASAAVVDSDSAASLCSKVDELVWINKVGSHAGKSLRASANDLAYVIYTSGSTGLPKGVAIEHRNFVSLHRAMKELFSGEDLTGMFAGASICFDVSVMETLGTLSLGGTVILGKNTLELPYVAASQRIRSCATVPSVVQAMLSTAKLPKSLQCLVLGGEVLKKSLVKQIYAQNPAIRIINAYGPTEDSVFSTFSAITPETKLITIGKSVTNSRAYILDDNLQPVAAGVSGELYLAGDKLARGYLHDEVLTKQHFIEIEPSDLIADNRLYKTGDLCRWTESEEIDFLGRVDQQVKIRGFRVELEEIESVLDSMDGIKASATTVVEGGIGQKILVACIVVHNEKVSGAEIKSYVSQRLPNYMVPQIIRYLDKMPLSPSGKLDREKIVLIANEGYLEKNEDALGADVEQRSTVLSVIQKEVALLLNLRYSTDIVPERSLDDLGLDSLSKVELSRRLSASLGQDIPYQAIIRTPTVNALVDYIVSVAEDGVSQSASNKPSATLNETLTSFQSKMKSSHLTFLIGNAPAWNAIDKGKLLREILHEANESHSNPFGKVLRTGSSSRGIVTDAYHGGEQEAIIWSTNLYFGMNRDRRVIREATRALEKLGTGMGTSAAASGMTDLHAEFEQEFAELVGKPSACLFPTGYSANLGAIAGLLGKDDVIIIDQLCHASIVDGAHLSRATLRMFQHNNASDLESVLKAEVTPYRTALVVLEGVYSMGEGSAPVAKIVRVAKKYNALVLVDEAHSFGFYGKNGAGICAEQGVTEEVDFIMTTLSKTMGSIGGVVAGSKDSINILKSSARAYIFQASVSPGDIAAALTALRCIRADNTLCERLWDTTRYMRQQFEEMGYDLGAGDGPIVTPHFLDKDKLFAIAHNLYRRGIQASAVTYPIVEIGRSRLRFICSASHTREDVDKTLAALVEAECEVNEQFAAMPVETKDEGVTQESVSIWGNEFCSYLKKSMAKTSEPTPNLSIAAKNSEQSSPVVIFVKDGEVTLATDIDYSLAYCSLLITDKAALTALQTSNVQGLLRSITKGGCILKGQVEAFIWLVGRMVDRRQGGDR